MTSSTGASPLAAEPAASAKAVYAGPMQCGECSATIIAIDAEVDPRAISLRFKAQCGHEVPPERTRVLWREGMRWSLPVVDGVSLGAAERYRQVHEEGYTAEHDAALEPNDLTWAAWCLLDAAAADEPVREPPKMWPEGAGDWKPDHEPLRRLVIAQALIAAEIDRRLMEQRRTA